MFAITDAETSLWMVALLIGAVVVAVVIALLSLLLNIVKDIDRGVLGVWETAKRVAANTATTWQLRQFNMSLDALKAEILHHRELLGSDR